MEEIISLSNWEQRELLWALRKILTRKSLSKDRRQVLTQILMKLSMARGRVLKLRFQELA